MEDLRKKINNDYYTYYIVEKDDTLYKISKMFNVNPLLVSELNGLKENEYIYPGQTLIIPKKGIIYYITKEDDTLKTVSNIFNVKEADLIRDNKTIYLLPNQLIFYRE